MATENETLAATLPGEFADMGAQPQPSKGGKPWHKKVMAVLAAAEVGVAAGLLIVIASAIMGTAQLDIRQQEARAPYAARLRYMAIEDGARNLGGWAQMRIVDDSLLVVDNIYVNEREVWYAVQAANRERDAGYVFEDCVAFLSREEVLADDPAAYRAWSDYNLLRDSRFKGTIEAFKGELYDVFLGGYIAEQGSDAGARAAFGRLDIAGLDALLRLMDFQGGNT